MIEFIGGSVLAATPQISYRRLLEALCRRGLSLRAWSYVPGFDHQAQATEAWRAFRGGAAGPSGPAPRRLPVLRLGHSLGCKLHLLAPDGGRGSDALAAMSFNNFSADRSMPLLADLAPRFGFRRNSAPHHRKPCAWWASLPPAPQPAGALPQRWPRPEPPPAGDAAGSAPVTTAPTAELAGDHLTPASAGLRQNLLGAWADDPQRQRQIDRLAAAIDVVAFGRAVGLIVLLVLPSIAG